MLVSVTEIHIERGRRADPLVCPLALAIGEATGAQWSVGLNVCHRTNTNTGKREPLVQLPPKAVLFREAFDNAKRVTPFEFELEQP